MKLAIAIAFLPAASGFTQISQKTTSSSRLNALTFEKRENSIALPFAERPKLLDGTLAGDVGFDPLGFAGSTKDDLMFMREAEIKHSRLAMLAVIGWPIAELYDKPISDILGLPSMLTSTGKSPSILNGGLDQIDSTYWLTIIFLAGIVEIQNGAAKNKDTYVPGDCNFDPLDFFPSTKEGQMSMMTKEIKHGRIAMLAILGFAAQEAITGVPVINETPGYFFPSF